MVTNIKDFNDYNDLKHVVYPALTSKVKELKCFGYDFINQDDVWDVLYELVWSGRRGVALCDVVNDILNFNNEKLYKKFIEKKMNNDEVKDEVGVV